MLNMTRFILRLIKLPTRTFLRMANDYFDFDFYFIPMLLLRNSNHNRNIICYNIVSLGVIVVTALHLEPL